MSFIENKNLIVAKNLRYKNADGDIVGILLPLDYLVLTGQAVSALISRANAQQTILDAQDGRIEALENITIPTQYITPEVDGGNISAGLTPIDELLEDLVINYDEFIAVAGDAADMTAAVAAQCVTSNSAAFAGGTVGGIAGWNTNPTKMAQSFKNLWLLMCDTRSGLSVVNARTSVTCADLVIAYNGTITNNGKTLNIYLAGYSFIPEGFSDVNSGSTITVTDSIGNIFTDDINVTLGASGSEPIVFDLTSSALFFGSDYNVNITSNITNGSITCNKSTLKTISNNTPICPGVSSIVPGSAQIAVLLTPYLLDNTSYEVTIYESDGTTVISSQTTTNPTTTFSTTFTGLTASTVYKIGVQVVYLETSPVECTLLTTSTTS